MKRTSYAQSFKEQLVQTKNVKQQRKTRKANIEDLRLVLVLRKKKPKDQRTKIGTNGIT